MKKITLAFIFFASLTYASESVDFLQKTISNNPNHSFYNGVDYAIVNNDIQEKPKFKITKGGTNPLGGFMMNTFGQIIRLRSVFDADLEFDNFTLTFSFESPNGARHTFNCHAIDQVNCGKIELKHCSKSAFGYSLSTPFKEIYVYNEEKFDKCTRNSTKVNQDTKSKKMNSEISKKSNSIRNDTK